MIKIFICVLIGIIIGIGIGRFIINRKPKNSSGILKVVRDEDGPYLFLELHENVENVCTKKTVIFYVENINSQQ